MLGADVGNNEASAYEYDSYDRLVRISQGETEIENVYDGEGRNISRKTDGKSRLFVYDGNTVHSYGYNEFGKQKDSAENLFLP